MLVGRAVLKQEQDDKTLHPVAYASHTLCKAESMYGITDLQAPGLVWAPKHFRPYLLGHHCVAFTDCSPLKAMSTTKHSSRRWVRWAGIIAEFDIDIHYRPGRVNSNADALSRSPIETGCNVSQVSSTVIEGQVEESSIAKAMLDEIVSLQLEDLLLAAIVQYLTNAWNISRGA